MIYVRSGIQEALWGKVRLAEEKINECGVKLNVAKREKEEVERIVREKEEDRRNAIGKNLKKRTSPPNNLYINRLISSGAID